MSTHQQKGLISYSNYKEKNKCKNKTDTPHKITRNRRDKNKNKNKKNLINSKRSQTNRIRKTVEEE